MLSVTSVHAKLVASATKIARGKIQNVKYQTKCNLAYIIRVNEIHDAHNCIFYIVRKLLTDTKREGTVWTLIFAVLSFRGLNIFAFFAFLFSRMRLPQYYIKYIDYISVLICASHISQRSMSGLRKELE